MFIACLLQADNKSIPAASTWTLSPESKFVHYCDNETIGGVEFKTLPDVGDRLLIGDVSSDFLSKPMDVSKFALIYGGAQKNIGPSGVTIVIVRQDLMGNARYASSEQIQILYRLRHAVDSFILLCWQ